MAGDCTVVIGAQGVLDALRDLARGEGEVLAFNEDQIPAALQAITKRRPKVVTLERLFAATARGAAFIKRLKADPNLASVEIRVVSHDGAYSRVSPRRAPGAAATPPEEPTPAAGATPAAAADWHGTRRSQRFRMKDGTEMQVEGVPAVLIDLSAMGAQIVLKSAVRPAQQLRINLADDLGNVRFVAIVAWVSFEIPKGTTRYRAGLEFKDAEPKSVEAFAARHKTKT